jgi:hypothetical protein
MGLFADLDAAGLAVVVCLVLDGFLVAVDLAGFATLELEETAGFFSPFFSAGLPIFKTKRTKRKWMIDDEKKLREK